jgi:hypothetical protein
MHDDTSLGLGIGPSAPNNSYMEILAEGHRRSSGLLQLAWAELLDGLPDGDKPCTPEQRIRACKFLRFMARVGPTMTSGERRQHIREFQSNFDRKIDA